LRPYVPSSHHSASLKYVENCNHKTNRSIQFDTERPVYINNTKGSLFLPCLTLNRCALYQMSKLRLCGKHSKNNYYSEATYWTLSRDVEWSLIHYVFWSISQLSEECTTTSSFFFFFVVFFSGPYQSSNLFFKFKEWETLLFTKNIQILLSCKVSDWPLTITLSSNIINTYKLFHKIYILWYLRESELRSSVVKP